MSHPYSESTAWQAVRNEAGQCSIWPSGRELPPGWDALGPAADRSSALAHAVDHCADLTGPVRSEYDSTQTVDGLFLARATANGGEEAIREGGDVSTYADLLTKMGAARAALAGAGVSRHDVVAVCLPRGSDMIAFLLATMSLGAMYLPLDLQYPAARIRHMLDDSGAAVAVVESGVAADALPEGVTMISCSDVKPTAGSLSVETLSMADDPAYLMFTSGSTGLPKAVVVTHSNLVSFLEAMTILLPADAARRVIFNTRLSFDIAFLEIFMPLLSGGTCVVVPESWKLQPRKLARLIAQERPTLIQATPATWRLLFDAGLHLTDDQIALCGGDILPPNVAGLLRGATQHAFNVYGPTEATVWATAWPISAGGSVLIGRELAHAKAYVLDDQGDPVSPLDGRGQLFIGGPAVSAGYWGRPALTCERFVPDPWSAVPGGRMYATGDVVDYVDGELRYCHRLDTQVKLNGNRVELGEIESVATHIDGVKAAVAVVVHWTESSFLHLVVESDQEAEGLEQRVRAGLSESLPEWMLPRTVAVLGALPLTHNGKVDRLALERQPLTTG